MAKPRSAGQITFRQALIVEQLRVEKLIAKLGLRLIRRNFESNRRVACLIATRIVDAPNDPREPPPVRERSPYPKQQETRPREARVVVGTPIRLPLAFNCDTRSQQVHN